MANAGPRYKLLALELPSWLAQSLSPWTLEAAQLWHNGLVRLDLRSAKARVPVGLELDAGKLVVKLLDSRIDASRGASLVRALRARLATRRELLPYLRRLSELAAAVREPETSIPSELGVALALFGVWPAREHSPDAQVPELPDGASALALPPAATAARILYRLARGEIIVGLSQWEALPELEPEPLFVRLHLEVVALGLLGRRREALEVLARLEARTPSADQWLVLARLYEALEATELALAAHRQVVATRGERWDHLRLARVRGDFSPPAAALPSPDPNSPLRSRTAFVREVVKVLDMAARYDDALEVINTFLATLEQTPLEQAPIDLALRAATLHLWRNEGDQARTHLDRIRDREHNGAIELIEGALTLLAGHPQASLAMLGKAEKRGCKDLSLSLWKGEALLALGELEHAQTYVAAHILSSNTLLAYLLMLLIRARLDSVAELEADIQTGTFLDGMVRDVLPSLCPPEALASAHQNPREFADLVRALLDQMGGNRSAKPTWCRLDAQGQPRLSPVVLQPTGREAAVANLVRLRNEPAQDVLDGFEPLLQAYPKSPFPCTYRGEILIWLGRYDDALASFAQADTRGRTRWSYVGRAAAYDLLEKAEQSDHWGTLGAEIFGELETATTHVYRGERLRKLGDWERAREDLEIALRAKPKRVGARMNLALLCRATGDEAGWEQAIAQLELDAPGLLFELGARPGQAIDEAMLLACLERMVGNRSSFLHTIIDAQGEFRVIPGPARWVGHVRLSLCLYRDAIATHLLRRWL